MRYSEIIREAKDPNNAISEGDRMRAVTDWGKRKASEIQHAQRYADHEFKLWLVGRRKANYRIRQRMRRAVHGWAPINLEDFSTIEILSPPMVVVMNAKAGQAADAPIRVSRPMVSGITIRHPSDFSIYVRALNMSLRYLDNMYMPDRGIYGEMSPDGEYHTICMLGKVLPDETKAEALARLGQYASQVNTMLKQGIEVLRQEREEKFPNPWVATQNAQ